MNKKEIRQYSLKRTKAEQRASVLAIGLARNIKGREVK